MKCPEAMRIVGDYGAAVLKYVETGKAMRELASDRESPEFHQASQAAKAAKESCSWHAWNLRKHRQKHGC